MSWEENCVRLAKLNVDWFWAEFSADAYFSSAPEEVPPLEERILWFALPTDRPGVSYALGQLRKAAELLRNAAGEIDKVATGDLMVDWEGDAAQTVKDYISSVKTSCAHLERYIDALMVAADAHGKRLDALETDVTNAIEHAKRAVEAGNDWSGKVAETLAAAILAVPSGGSAAGAMVTVTSALTDQAAKAFGQTFAGDGVYATRELKEALGGLRDRFASAMESVGNALDGLAIDVSLARIPAEVELPRVAQDRAFDASQFYIDDPNYGHGHISTGPLLPEKELVPRTEQERDKKKWGEAGQERQRGREDARPTPGPYSGS